jgi:SHS2 domain-containing protein
MTPPAETPTPADRIIVDSQTPQELFEEVARQLFTRLIDLEEVGAALREKVAVEGESLEQLLKEWVMVLGDLVRVQHMIFSGIHVTHLKTPEKGPYSLQAEAMGELLDLHRHTLKQDPSWLKPRRVTIRK